MKKRALLLVFVLAMCLTTSVALAEYYDYEATICRNYFTTGGYVQKEDYMTWDCIMIVAAENGIRFTPSLPAGRAIYQQACAIGGSSVVLGPKTNIYPGFTGPSYGGMYGLTITNLSYANTFDIMRARIYNPYGSSYNMETSGSIWVDY